MTTARAIVGAVVGVISMLQMVDSPDVNVMYLQRSAHSVLLIIFQ